jgi:hypothetical protein
MATVENNGVRLDKRSQSDMSNLLTWDELAEIMQSLLDESNGEAMMLGNGGTGRAIIYRNAKELILGRKEGKHLQPFQS